MLKTLAQILFTLCCVIFSVNNFAAKKYERITLDDGKLLELSLEPLAKNEGYLVLEITPKFKIKKIEITKVRGFAPKFILKDVAKKSVHVIKLKTGDYYFSKIKLPSNMYFKLDHNYKFSVDAGVINYPGEFLIEWTYGFNTAELILKNRLFSFVETYGEYIKEQYSNYKLIYNGSYTDNTAEEFSLCCE